jgi:beta-phosphoglucomutase
LRHAASSLGYVLPPVGEVSWYVGMADRDAFSKICRENGREATSEAFTELSRLKWQFARESLAQGSVDVYPGTIALARQAHEMGVPVAICSGARRREIEHILQAQGLREMIVQIVSADDVTQTKPHPEPYLTSAAMLGKRPHECIALEDSDVGVASATGAGVYTIAVGHTLPQSRLTRADLFVENSQMLCWPGT